MFGFYLKKVLASLLTPLAIVFLLLLISIYFIYKKRAKVGLLTLIIATLLLWLFSSRPFSHSLIYSLEANYPALKNPPKATAILLLGGDLETRGWEVLNLHKLFPTAHIFTSGYKGSFFQSDAIRAREFLIRAGVNSKLITPLLKPKDTIEEARELKKRIGKKPFFLVSSAYHIPRAMMIFTHEGLHPIPAPADFIRRPRNLWTIFPGVKNLLYTQKALHEYLGILWLKIKGY